MLWAFILSIFAFLTFTNCVEIDDVKSGIQHSTPANSSMPPLLDATASKLIRYRSKPPPNFYRYKTQPHKRSRPRVIKSPKVKHNRPKLTHVEQNLEPSNYYKFKPTTLSYKPEYSYDEIHYEVSSEYPNIESIPLSSYETQAMDLDFYGDTYPNKKVVTQYEYTKPQKASPQYEYAKPQKVAPQYEYAKPQKTVPQYEYTKPHKTFKMQQPHKEYGVPKESEYSSYNLDLSPKPEVHYDISYHEEMPEQEYAPGPRPKQKYEDFLPYGVPPKKDHQSEQVAYQIPNNKYEAPVSSYHPKESPKEETYQANEKKLPNSGYNYNFAEPPTDIHIIHSPSYDIETLPPKHDPPQNIYEPAHETYGPSPNQPSYNENINYKPPVPGNSYHQPIGGQFAEPPGSYLPPPHQPEDLPLNKNHMPPGYDYPKSSYEVPLYDPVPFDTTTPDEDYFPPNYHNGASQHEHASESKNNLQHSPSTSAAKMIPTKQEHEQVQQANTKVHRFTPSKRRYKYPSRYPTTEKVPVQTEETHLSDAPSSEFLDEALSTSSTFRPRRKRKRTKAPPSEKHNLDVPELKEAFETGRDQSDELAAYSSNIKENVDLQSSNKTPQITQFSPSNTWNPMRIRTKQRTAPRGQRLGDTNLNDLKNVEMISIQKSHSHSYYAGTEPPLPAATKRTKTMTSRADAMQMRTGSSTTTLKVESTMKPTRGLTIDTTYFKVKDNEDQDFYDGTGQLPKNHKLF